MAAIINTNIASLNAQRNLTMSQSSLATSLQRLSSGLRINSAKDDAAGMAISERFTTQIKGNTQAARNANDAISLSQTAESAMNEVTSNLQRIRELAVQSLNATNSASDRNALDSEVQQLKAEIDRVSTQTAFNGVKLLDGSFSAQTFQVGANAGETISISSITNLRTSALGQGYGATKAGTTLGAATGITGANQFTFAANGVTYDVYQGTNIAGNAQSIANAINSRGISGMTATAAATSVTGDNSGTPVTGAGTGILTLNGKAINVALTVGGGATNVSNAMAAINNNSAATGVSAALSGTGLKLTAVDGRNIEVAWAVGTSTASTLGDVGLGTVAATTYSSYSLSYTGDSSLPAITIGGSAAANVKGQADGTMTPATTGEAVSLIDVTTVKNANTALAAIDNALTVVNGARSSMGAYQNRFQSVVNNLQTTVENLTASRSRIQDTDFAAETAQLTRAQILQQAGTAMLAQANQLPNTVLSLLK
jgi:flagellin